MSRRLALASLLLAVGTVATFVVFVQMLRPLAPVLYLSGLGLAVVLAAASVARSRGWLTVSALVVSVILLGLAGVFNFVVMRVPTTASAFVVGQPAPDFTLADAGGRPVRLADYRGRHPVVLVFYRGYW